MLTRKWMVAVFLRLVSLFGAGASAVESIDARQLAARAWYRGRLARRCRRRVLCSICRCMTS